MDLFLSWLIFPTVLALGCVGCGLAFEAVIDTKLPGALVPGCGFAVMIVVGQFLTLTADTTKLVTPVIVTLTVLGFGLAVLRGALRRPPPPLLVAAGALFAVYAAPIVLSGSPTLAGYIRLDDTATWLAFTDQLMENGRDLGGLSPSTHEATLALNIGDGYPVGVFLPLGFASQLLAIDPAWTVQPYMAFMAVLFVMAAWVIAGPVIRSPWLRSAAVALAAQPALLFGYYLWGGIKEVAAVAMIATVAALAADLLERPADWRRAVALGLGAGALVGILSGGGGLWLAPILVGTLILLVRAISPIEAVRQAAVFAATLLFLAMPVILAGGFLPPTSSPLSDADAKGNLIAPLEPAQVLGVWPAGDFRVDPDAMGVTYVLCALALALVIAGAWWALRRGATAAVLLLAGALAGGTALVLIGSPWVDGKALATASPIILLTALIGVAAAASFWRTTVGVAIAVVIGGGVVWSNVLAYSEVNLAPHEQFEELEAIGRLVENEGPSLITEYSPYGARHFLREGDPEAVSELRRRVIPKLNGNQVRKGVSADTDELQADDLYVYRSLVKRRSPVLSRPPSDYRLVWSGGFYELWQRPVGLRTPPARLPLGDGYDPVSSPPCDEVEALAAASDRLLAATGMSPIILPLVPGTYPPRWTSGLDAAPAPNGSGTIRVEAVVERPGEYNVWLGESVRASVTALIDGERVGEVRHELNNHGQYVGFGAVTLEPGAHEIELRFRGLDFYPGSGGRGVPVGPIVLSSAEAADSRIIEVESRRAAERLCGRDWDWIEVSRAR